MRLFRLRLALLVVLVIPTYLSAQQSTSTSTATGGPQAATSQTVQRDLQALAAIQNSIAAMGGTAVVSQVQNSVVSGTSIDAASNSSATVTFKWTYAGVQFRLENGASAGTHILVSSGGSPQEFHDGNWFSAMPLLARTNLAYHIPALVLFSELNDQSYSLIYVGTTTLNGSSVVHIQTRDDSDALGHLFTQQDWYFDPTTGLPVTVQYQISPMSQDASQFSRGSMGFSEFKPVSGLLVPFHLQIVEGPASIVATVTAVAFNSNIDASEFVPSSGSAQ